MNDIDYMTLAYHLALKGRGRTSPNPLVGAVLVKNRKILGQGWHRRCGGDHAEIEALKKAGSRVKGSTLYVTLEPCRHYGRTPPCVDRIIREKIKGVVVGMKDPNPLTNGRSLAALKRSGIKVKLLSPDSERSQELLTQIHRMNEPFCKYVTEGIPFVTAKTAQTLDGKIATSTGRSKWITSAAARRYTHRLRNDVDAIMVGINTVLKDDPRLDAPAKRLKKVVLDPFLKISPKARLFHNTQPDHCFLATTPKAPQNKVRFFQDQGIPVLIYSQKKGRIPLRPLLQELAKREISHVLIEGGAETVGYALRDKVVDKMMVLIAPKIIGDREALGSISGLKTQDVNRAIRLKDMTWQRLGQDFLIEGYVDYK